MLARFTGEDGKARLHEVLSATFLLNGVADISKLIESADLLDVASGDALIRQGDADSYMYIIVSGSFHIEVNERFLTTRHQGGHVGEAAMIDLTAKRNATVRAAENSVVLRCSDRAFSTFADANPQVWRRIAIELSRRLTERVSGLRVPRTQPVLFLGCSTEGLTIAREVQSAFHHDDFVVQLWTDGIFRPSHTPVEDLSRLPNEIDFAVMVITPDDILESRDERYRVIRDNVLFELGLCIGAIGRERAFLLSPRGGQIKIPSDLLGVTPLDFVPPPLPNGWPSALGPACNELRKIIKGAGPR